MHALSPTYYIVFTAVTTVAVLLQALVLLAIYIAIRRSSSKLQETLDEVKSKALPAIELARNLLEDVSPKLKTATGNLVEVSGTLREQAKHVNMTVDALLEKTNAQINRVDEMATATFNALSHASRAIDIAIALPARRMTGILHGVKVGIDVLMRGSRQSAAKKSEAAKDAVKTAPTISDAPNESPEEIAAAAAKPA